MALMEPNDAYLAINAHVRTTATDATEELEITLFDATKEGGEGAVLTITAKNFTVRSRDAQAHELHTARVAADKKYRESWLFSLDSSTE